MDLLIYRIRKAISNYKNNLYTEKDFQVTIESVTSMISENGLREFKKFFSNIESDLEDINFMIDKERRREKYLAQINRVENYLNHYYCSD